MGGTFHEKGAPARRAATPAAIAKAQAAIDGGPLGESLVATMTRIRGADAMAKTVTFGQVCGLLEVQMKASGAATKVLLGRIVALEAEVGALKAKKKAKAATRAATNGR